MDDLVSKQEKTKWLKELIAYQNEITDQIQKSYVGKTQIVLFEGFVAGEEFVVFGRIDANLVVRCKGCGDEIGLFKLVKVVDFKRTFLVGEIL